MARRRQLLALVGAVAGSVLFAYAVRSAGVADILDGIRRVGWGLIPILMLAGVRFLIRTQCWRLCVPPTAKIGFVEAFRAFLAGDAVGSVTPLGLFASEPTKAFLARHRLATRESVASLALENLLYAASVLAMVGLGVAVVLATAPLPTSWRWGGAAALAGMVTAALVGLRLLRGTWDEARGVRPGWREKLAGVRQAVVGVPGSHGARLWQVFALDVTFHAVAVLEVFVTLRWLMGDRSPTLAQAIGFEALNRVVTVVFKFVPFRLGVDEISAGALAPLLAVSPAAGVTLAVVRKVRNLLWAGVGLVLVAIHPTPPASPAPDGPATDLRTDASARF